MANKKQILKGLLATASMTAVVLGGAQMANAVPAVRNTGAVTPVALNAVAGFVQSDELKYDNANITVNVSGAGGISVVSAIDTDNNGGSMLGLVGGDLTLGSVSDLGGGAGSLAVNFTAAHTLTLSGTAGTASGIAANTYNHLGAISFGGTASTVVVTSTGATFAGNIVSGGAGFGTLTVSGNNNEFDGTIGNAAAIGLINVTGANTATFTNTTKAIDIQAVAAGSVINFNANTNNAQAVAVTGDISGVGTVNFTGADATAGAAGNAASATTTKGIGTSSAGVITALNVTATGGNGNTGGGAAHLGGVVTLDKVATTGSFTATGGNGIAGAAAAGGAGGTVMVATTTNAKSLALTGGAGNAGSGAANVAGGAGGAITLVGNVVTTSTSAGAVVITSGAGGAGVAGNAGKVGGNGGAVNFGGSATFASDVTITTGAGGAGITGGGGGGAGGAVAFGGATTATGKDITVKSGLSASTGNVNDGLGGVANFAGVVTANSVILDTAAVPALGVTALGSGAAFGSNLVGNLVFNADLPAYFANGTNITGTVTTRGDNIGTLYFAGGTNIASQIGTSATDAVKLITIGNNAGATTTNVTANVYAHEVRFQENTFGANNAANAGTILNLGKAAVGGVQQGQTISGNVTTSAANAGILNVYGQSSVGGAIGATNAINAINFMENNAQLTVGGATIKTNNAIAFGNFSGTSLVLTDVADDLVVNGDVTTTGNNIGNIVASGMVTGKTLTFANNAGGVGNALQSINAGSGKIVFTGDAYVQSVNASDLSLNNANYNLVYTTTNGIVHVGNAAMTLLTGTNLGSLATLDFAKANLVTVGDTVNLVATQGTASTANAAQVSFAGNSTFDVAMRTGDAFTAFSIAGANKTVTIAKDLPLAVGVALNFAADGTAVIQGNVSGGTGIDALGANTGTAIFQNTGTATVDGGFGITKALKEIKLAGGNVVFGKSDTVRGAANAAAQTITFTSTATPNTTLTIYGNAAGLGAATIQTEVDGQGILAIDADYISGRDVATEAKKLNALLMLKDTTTTIAAGKVYADIKTALDGNGTVDFGGAVNDKIYNLGTSTEKLKAVNFGFDATILGNAYATNFNVGGNIITASQGLHGTFNFGADGTLKVSSGSIDQVATANDAEGTVNFTGKTGAINGALGTNALGLKNLTLSGGAGALITANANVFADAVTQGVETLSLGGNVTFGGGAAALAGANKGTLYTATNSTISLGQNTMTVVGNFTPVGNIAINTTYGSTSGNVKTSMMDFANTDVITFNVATVSALPSTGATYTLATITDLASTKALPGNADIQTAGAIDPAKLIDLVDIQTASTNRFVEWSFAAPTITTTEMALNATATRDITFTPAVSGSLTPAGKDFIAKLNAQQDGITGVAMAIATALGNMTDTQQTNIITQLFDASSATADAAAQTLSSLSGNIVSTQAILAARSFVAAEGMSAGDATANNMGAWISGTVGRETQQMRGTSSGFRSNTQGGLVGFDTALNESTIVGIAVGTSKTDVKYKNTKAGDKTKADTYFASLYGMHEFMDNWVVQGSAMFANSSVNDKSKRATDTVTGKYDAMSYGAQVFGGYKFRTGDTGVVTPMVGFKYNTTNADSYKETGSVFVKNVGKRTYDQLIGSLGARVTMTSNMGDVAVTPEFHGFMNYDLKNKATKVNFSVDGLNGAISATGPKAAKVLYNLGAGVMAKSGMVEYGAGYDANFGAKYMAHQGSLKVRVNF